MVPSVVMSLITENELPVMPSGSAGRTAPAEVFACIPIFNDSESARLLVERLAAIRPSLPVDLRILFVNDGSDAVEAAKLAALARQQPWVESLRLRRNLGHQRAIAIGLACLAATRKPRAVVVMDGDGEDAPESLRALLARGLADGNRATFATRLKRHDSLGFLCGYRGFRLLHRLLVGRDINVGNFSVLPAEVLERVVGISEIWNHYAAAVIHARVPIDFVPIARGRRLAGVSKMNLPGLVQHGLCALSVWSDVIIARLFVAAAVAVGGVATLATLLTVLRSVAPARLSPGWVTAAWASVAASVMLAIACLVAAMAVLGARSATAFLPLRDWRHYALLPNELSHEVPDDQA